MFSVWSIVNDLESKVLKRYWVDSGSIKNLENLISDKIRSKIV